MTYIATLKDEFNGSTVGENINHWRIHQGQVFMAFVNESNLANATTLQLYFKTPASPALAPHLIAAINGSENFDFELIEAPTVSGTGTQVEVFNKNRQSSVVSSVLDIESTVGYATQDPTTVSGGTVIRSELLGASNKEGQQLSFDGELILKADTNYVFKITSRANNNRVHINLEWYEPAS